MKQTEKETWIEQTLDSLNGVERAEAPDSFLENALNRMKFGPARIVRLSPLQWYSAAACGLILVAANLFVCADFARQHKRAVNAKEQFGREYFDFSEGINL